MISSFPKVGFFMSTSGIEDYLQSGRPVMRDLPRERRPLFLIADVSSLQLQRTRPSKRHSLMADDIEVLRNNFIPQWGGYLGCRQEDRSRGRRGRVPVRDSRSRDRYGRGPDAGGDRRDPGQTWCFSRARNGHAYGSCASSARIGDTALGSRPVPPGPCAGSRPGFCATGAL